MANQENAMQWYRVELLVSDAEYGSTVLWSCEAAGVEVQDHETFMEGHEMAPLPEGKARLIAFFELSEEVLDAEATLTAKVQGALDQAGVDHTAMSVHAYNDTSWETAWMAFFKPVNISPRVVVGPPWEEFQAPEGGTKLVIEPGMAFGTGTHETTQLCAAMLDDLLDANDAPRSVLDVGCGSAILSMAAARLGASPVVGIDVDAHAVGVACDNLVVNELADEISLSTTPLNAVEGNYDIVIANILGHILLHLRNDLYARVTPEGSLLLSGVTTLQDDDFLADFLIPGWRVVNKHQRGDWVAYQVEKAVE